MITGKFKKLRPCMNSVRYDPSDEKAGEITKGFYLMNDAYEKLGKPTTIQIGVSNDKEVT